MIKTFFSRAREFFFNDHKYMLVALAALIFCVLCSHHSNKSKQELAVKVLRDLYEFGNVEQLQAQQRDLRLHTTEDVYAQLTYDNEERRLNTYLKFSEESCSVVIIDKTNDYIIYSLDCATIESSRHFIFTYNINDFNKIDSVYEAELIDFIAGG